MIDAHNPIYSNNRYVNSITVESGATLSIAAGGLIVNANSTIEGALSMTGGSVEANGSGVTLAINGTTTISNATVDAESGAAIDLSQSTIYGSSNSVQSFEANGTGSTINLANLSSFTGVVIQLTSTPPGAVRLRSLR